MHHSRFRATRIVGGVLITGAVLVAPTPAGAMPPACDRVDNPCPTGPKTAKGTVDVAAGQTGA